MRSPPPPPPRSPSLLLMSRTPRPPPRGPLSLVLPRPSRRSLSLRPPCCVPRPPGCLPPPLRSPWFSCVAVPEAPLAWPTPSFMRLNSEWRRSSSSRSSPTPALMPRVGGNRDKRSSSISRSPSLQPTRGSIAEDSQPRLFGAVRTFAPPFTDAPRKERKIVPTCITHLAAEARGQRSQRRGRPGARADRPAHAACSHDRDSSPTRLRARGFREIPTPSALRRARSSVSDKTRSVVTTAREGEERFLQQRRA